MSSQAPKLFTYATREVCRVCEGYLENNEIEKINDVMKSVQGIENIRNEMLKFAKYLQDFETFELEDDSNLENSKNSNVFFESNKAWKRYQFLAKKDKEWSRLFHSEYITLFDKAINKIKIKSS